MSEWETLADYKGWSILWQPSSGKLYVRRPGLYAPSHDFHERPRSRVTAIEVAKAWINRR